MLVTAARPRIAALLIAALALVVACTGGNGEDVPTATATPAVEVTPTAEPTSTPTATSEPTSTPTPTPTPDPRPARCRGDEAALQARLDDLAAAIEEAMAGYNGEWGVGMVDLDCDIEFTVRPEYVQYTASAGKIVPIIAALRAIEAGELAFEAVERHLLPVMQHSLDADANAINAMVTPEQVQEVLALAGVSEATNFAHYWNQANMPALDLARVWAALLRGELLGEEMTEYLLDLASRPEIPPGLETFPLDPELPGFQIGQKAGYYVYDGIPYYLLGAGYLRPVDAAGEEVEDGGPGSDAGHRGVALVFSLRSLNPDLFDPQRRAVFPLLAQYIDAGYIDGR